MIRFLVFAELIRGDHDDVPEYVFYMVGNIAEVYAKADAIRAHASSSSDRASEFIFLDIFRRGDKALARARKRLLPTPYVFVG